MTKKELEEKNKVLEQRLVNLEAKFMGQIAGLKGDMKDKYLLMNDRVTEAFFIIDGIERKCCE